jgi:hypothetical protein
MRQLLLPFALFLMVLQARAQSTTFNQEKGVLFNVQGGGLFGNLWDSEPQPRLSPVIGYKTGKFVFFSGYEMHYYPPTAGEYGELNEESYIHTAKVGFHIYPHKNLRQVKVFYQALYTYHWETFTLGKEQITEPQGYSICIGGGIDYFILRNFSVGYDMYIGAGQLWHYNQGSFSLNKLNYNFSFKYFLWKKQ